MILIIGIPLSAYVTRRTLTSASLALERWADAAVPIAWHLNPNHGANVSGSRDLAEVFRQTFQAWSGVPTARVLFTEGAAITVANAAQDGINLISGVPSV